MDIDEDSFSSATEQDSRLETRARRTQSADPEFWQEQGSRELTSVSKKPNGSSISASHSSGNNHDHDSVQIPSSPSSSYSDNEASELPARTVKDRSSSLSTLPSGPPTPASTPRTSKFSKENEHRLNGCPHSAMKAAAVDDNVTHASDDSTSSSELAENYRVELASKSKSVSDNSAIVKKRRGRPPNARRKIFNTTLSDVDSLEPPLNAHQAKRRRRRLLAQSQQPKKSNGNINGCLAPVPVRATRATVKLPPGYIEGVKSSRRSRKGGNNVNVCMKDGSDSSRESSVEPSPIILMKLENKGNGLLPSSHTAKEATSKQIMKRVFPKRRKIDPRVTAERSKANAAMRLKLIAKLDVEMERVKVGTHPLIEIIRSRLELEKKDRLAKCAAERQQQQVLLFRGLSSQTMAIWRQWTDAKDKLKIEEHLSNYNQLKDLQQEDESIPYLKDHPLFIKTYNLPPVSYFRAAVDKSTPAELLSRRLWKTGSPLEPPPINPSLDHSCWQLNDKELSDDIALMCMRPRFTSPLMLQQEKFPLSSHQHLGADL